MSAEAEATGLRETEEVASSDAEEAVTPALVRDVRLMADGRRITYYRRERQ